jgi:hypothetical protein
VGNVRFSPIRTADQARGKDGGGINKPVAIIYAGYVPFNLVGAVPARARTLKR